MGEDRLFTIAFSPAMLGFVAFLFALTTDLVTWRRLGSGLHGTVNQVVAGLMTSGLLIAALGSIPILILQLSKPNVGPMPGAPFFVVLLLGMRMATLALALVPRVKSDKVAPKAASGQISS